MKRNTSSEEVELFAQLDLNTKSCICSADGGDMVPQKPQFGEIHVSSIGRLQRIMDTIPDWLKLYNIL